MHHYDVTARSSAPPAVVFAAVHDVRSYVKWQPFTAVELVASPSEPPWEGAEWVLHHGRVSTRIRVLEAVPHSAWVYQVENQEIWRSYSARIDLAAASSGGTHIRWRGSFQPLVSGFHRFWDSYMERTMQERAENLAAFSTAATGGSTA